MVGDHYSAKPAGERQPLKTHEFRRDPFERLRLARRNVPSFPFAVPKRFALTVAAVAVATAALAGTSVFVAGARDARPSDVARERNLDEREAQLKQREQKVAQIEQRLAGSESEIRDSEKRVADLERRRSDLQRQVAELTAPVAPGEDEGPVSTDRSAAAAADDSSPPDETDAGDAPVAAASRASEQRPAPSTVAIDAPAEKQSLIVSDGATEASGPVRVFIHVRSTDPAARERAEAVAAELRRRGVAVAQIRGVVRPVRRDAVRFYYDADRQAVSTLQDAVRLASPTGDVDPQSQDFRGYRAPPKRGTLELWLS